MQATIHLRQPITDEDLFRIGEDNPGWQIERDGDGSLLMSPASTKNSPKNVEILVQMHAFAKRHGGFVCGPDAGFTMPDNAVLCPDASWTSRERWDALAAEQQAGYARIVPDICVELLSPSDWASSLQRKLRRYLEYGASYVILVDPFERTVWTEGTPPEGFSLDANAIFDA